MSDSPELLKPDEVTYSELQTEIGNLQAENEKLKADYAALLESNTAVTKKLERQVQELRSQLATERADREEIEVQLADLKQNSAPASELLELKDLKTHDLLDVVNQVIKQRKKSKMDLEDLKLSVKLLSEKLKESCDDTSQRL
ncbi:hypothetical protein QUA54_33000 [Microcoleus sp. MOSTC5]|uniref:hypothetical protein n=1 Tax=Microcoleus sp. MOSTC5 TaxID=3055378 RepID=UPI002FD35816